MKILVVTEKYWPEGGGGTLATHLIVKLLASNNFKISLLTGTKQLEKIAFVKHIYIPQLNVSNKVKLWISCMILMKVSWFKKLLKNHDVIYIPRYCYPIIRLAKQLEKKVIVHLHDYQPISWTAAVFNSKISNINQFKEILLYETLQHNSILRTVISPTLSEINRLVPFWLEYADEIIVVSKKQAKILLAVLPQFRNKLKVIYNPLPSLIPLPKKIREPIFLYLGGDSYVKGFYILLSAIQRFFEKMHGIKFLLAGTCGAKAVKLIRKLSSKSGIPIKILGPIPYREVLKLYPVSWASIFSSIIEEPLPYTVMESMFMETIPIASAVGGVPEIVENSIAKRYLFNPGSVDELADRILEVSSMTCDELIDMGYKLREHVIKLFNNERIQRKYLDIFSV